MVICSEESRDDSTCWSRLQVENHAVTIVAGETGSGKTTQIPQFLLSAGWCSDGYQVFSLPQTSLSTSAGQLRRHPARKQRCLARVTSSGRLHAA
jgi:ABC-type lipoprotein export system ATPase subunit